MQLPDVHNDQTMGRHRHGRTRFDFSRAKLNWSTTSPTAIITYFANTAGSVPLRVERIPRSAESFMPFASIAWIALILMSSSTRR
jgi:hypothetical protein